MQATMTQKVNGIDVEALGALQNEVRKNPASGKARFSATTRWRGGARSETEIDGWSLGGRTLPRHFSIPIDEPPELLGKSTAPNPQEVLMAGINACMMATYVAVSSAMGIPLEHVQIETTGELDLRGFLGIDKSVNPGYDEIQATVRIKGDGTPEQFRKVHDAVLATSPNYSNVIKPIRFSPRLVVE